MSTRTRLSRFSRYAVTTAILLGVLAITFGFYIHHQFAVDRANAVRINSLLLAAQLRESSDELTRMARSYVVTGDTLYRNRFQTILDIREGRSPRPSTYTVGSWDMEKAHSVMDATGALPPAALVELMQRAGFTRDELTMISQAKAMSDSLVSTEVRAMQLVNSGRRNDEAQRQLAIAMLWDEPYSTRKAAIMGRIDSFVTAVDRRTLAAVDRAERIALIIRFLFIAIGIALGIMLWWTYAALRQTMGGSVGDVNRRIAALGGGNFAPPGEPPPPPDSVLGWLTEAQLKLADIVRERALSEERTRAVIEGALDCIVSMDGEGRIIEFNPAAETTFGYSRAEAIGKHLADLIIPPALRVSHTQGLSRYLSTGQSRILGRRIEVPACRADGTEILVELSVTRVGSDPPVFTGFIRDISDRKRDEDKLREQASLLDKAQEAIIVRDLDHRIKYWNKGAERLYGWTSDEAVGRSAVALLHKNPTPFANASKQLMKAGEWLGELDKLAKDGTRLAIECRWTLVRDAGGAAECIMEIDTDITQRKNLEQQFLRAQRMESIGTLAGGIAHDLNNVLVPIMLSIDLLKETVAGAEERELLDTVAASSRRGADMVAQVLSFARGMDGRRVAIRVKHLVGDIEKIVSDTFPKSIEIRTLVKPDLWTILGDSTQLHQVLLNLCVNARDAMPEGGQISITADNVTLEERDVALAGGAQPGPYVLIEVEDTGIGMAPGIIDHIFDPFFTTKEIGKGTGLGLSTSLGIVRSHAGFLHVYSEEHKGTRFRVYLPARTEVGADHPERPILELARGNGETVLVVDDEASIRQITGQTLEAFGYRVLLAADGAEAIAIYAANQSTIAVVLTDMMMPVLDGPATIQVLERMSPRVRIIATSGLNANRDMATDAGRAVKHFLPKPYTAEKLLTTLQVVLSER